MPLGGVHLATDADVAQALRMDAYLGGAEPRGIPVGLYTSGGLEAPVYLDADFLLGPEAAHLNISGVSGLATKTSAVEFLLGSIFEHFPRQKGRVAAVCFNVKGPDLCFLDQAGALEEEDRRRYGRLGVPATPFERVRYYAPFKSDGVNLNTLRTHPALVGAVEPLVWGLREVLDYAEVLLNRDDIDAKADAFIDFLSDRVVDREFDDGFGGTHRVVMFADLERLFRAIFDGLELAGGTGRSDTWRTHHIATIRKVRNRLSNISTRAKGLVTDDGPSSDLPWGRFEDRTVYVVDVANVDPLGQDLVFARVVSKLREHLERRDLGVDAVVVFVDELNKYAPADGPETYVKKMLLDISERGRYLGLVLFGAEQFRSQVHRRVVGITRHQDQARHAPDRRADGAPSALHAADLRPVPTPRRAPGAGRSGAIPARDGLAVRGRGRSPAREARRPGAAEPGEGPDRRSAGGGRAPRSGPHPAEPAAGRLRALQEAARRPGRRRSAPGA
ncbi:MAG: hypothetical protein DMD67_18135 [Gemmatimonadetes bacterium]|nr:MAG: hypothetical protein DMD67_18135 [Gemmatimonadota bacterium]